MPMTGTGKVHKLRRRQPFADEPLPDVHPAWRENKDASKADAARAPR
jgi:hypothetical protein